MSRVKSGRIIKPKRPRSQKPTSKTWDFTVLSSVLGSPSTSSTRASSKLPSDAPFTDLDGDTIVAHQPTEMDDETIVVDESEYLPPPHRRKIKTQPPKEHIPTSAELQVQGWAEDEIWTYHKLSKMNEEPIFPSTWAQDFPSFPDYLFTKDYDLAFVKGLRASITDACPAFNTLMMAGGQVRCRIHEKLAQEPSLKRALFNYQRWMIRDARLKRKRFTPIMAILTAYPDESVERLCERCEKRFRKDGKAWHRKMVADEPRGRSRSRDDTAEVEEDPISEPTQNPQPLPILYGVLVKRSIMMLVSWNPNPAIVPQGAASTDANGDAPSNPMRTLGTYNWAAEGHDVWHALAAAIVFCKVRNTLVELDKQGWLGPELVESDPDL